jgi:hypothetical protein
MPNCKFCDAKVLWAELTLSDKVVTIQIDPKVNTDGDLRILPTHPDLPLRAEKITGRYNGPRYIGHRQTCPEQEPYVQKDSAPSWVREQES